MAKRRKVENHVDASEGPSTPTSPFATLAHLRDALPPGEAAEDRAPVSTPGSATFAPKVVLSRQRKGHGGKTVTVLTGVLLEDGPRAEFVRELGRALGTNVRVEADTIILAGDQRERAKAWLEARGAKRVVTNG